MTVVQLTRDSATLDDEISAPHVVAVELSVDAALGDVGEWISTHDYLGAVPHDESWVLRLHTRVGPPVARLVPRATGELDVVWLADRHHPLLGVGCLHLERQRSGADV